MREIKSKIVNVKVNNKKETTPVLEDIPLTDEEVIKLLEKYHDVDGVVELYEAKYREMMQKRDPVLSGKTYKIKPPEQSAATYITINDHNDSPFEMFINSKDTTHYQWTSALTRIISAVMRRERKEDMAFLANELKAVVDPAGGYWVGGKYVKSIVADIGMALESHLEDKGEDNIQAVYPPNAVPCHKCGEKALIKSDGCEECVACTYSKCA